MSGKYDTSYKVPNSVSLELIDSGRVTDVSTDLGTRAVLNVMKLWKMIDGKVEKQPKEYVWGGGRVENGGTLKANRGGIIHFTRTPGEPLKKGDVVSKTYNPFGDLVEEIKFPFDGYIRAYAGGLHQSVMSGTTMAYITHDK
jgi:predicted deacylase